MLSEAIEAVGKMLRAMPHGRPPDERGYIGNLAALLMQYPRQVATLCADPQRGVVLETRFLPTPADVVAFCERRTAELRYIVDRDDREKRLAREAREREDAEKRLATDRKSRPTYRDLQEKYGETWGIRTVRDDDKPRPKAVVREAEIEAANQRFLAREQLAAGMTDSSGASPGLLKFCTRVKAEMDEVRARREREDADGPA